MEELADRRVLVLGLGRSGRSAAAFLAARGAQVLAADERPAAELGDLAALAAGGVALRVGEPFPDPQGFDLVVPSPGVPRARWAPRARRALGDVELAWRALGAPVVAITGTNGKTTTTELATRLLVAAGLRAEAAGNIGRPALELVGRALDVAVLEVSSFQMEAVEAFRPRVAVVLNLEPDHIDRHGSFEAYREAKAQLFVRQEPGDVAIGNADDPHAAGLVARSGGQRWLFSRRRCLEAGAWWDAGQVVVRTPAAGGEPETTRIALDALASAGATAPPLDDLLAALLACRAVGADLAKAALGLAGFASPPHRRERVASHAGVAWLNDSKATNPAAARLALEAAEGPVVWIAGGRSKGVDLRPLVDAAVPRVRACIWIGEAAGELDAALAGRAPAFRARDLDEAVARAGELARAGDTVLFSPACASFDQFRSYEDRGERFRAAVRAWLAARGAA
jgi:UDP-N-acetylmuramoylalanine--D-glutamate ligase